MQHAPEQETRHASESRHRAERPACFSGSLLFRGANATLVSGVYAGMEGWTVLPVIGGTINYYRVSTGGEPGGFIAATVGGTQQRYIMSPDSRDGDRTSYVGGMLRYDVKIPEPASPPNSCITRDDVQIDNGTGNYAAWSCGIDPDSTWTS